MGNSKKSIIVSTEGGDVEVRKLALGDYAALLRVLKKLPAQFGKFLQENETDKLQDNEELFAALPEIIAEAIPEFAGVLAVVSDKDEQFFIEGDLADAIEVFYAALELNDYKKIANTVKKLMARKPANPALQ